MSFSSLGVATLGQKKFLSKQTINDFWIQNDLLSKKIFLLYQQKKTIRSKRMIYINYCSSYILFNSLYKDLIYFIIYILIIIII